MAQEKEPAEDKLDSLRSRGPKVSTSQRAWRGPTSPQREEILAMKRRQTSHSGIEFNGISKRRWGGHKTISCEHVKSRLHIASRAPRQEGRSYAKMRSKRRGNCSGRRENIQEGPCRSRIGGWTFGPNQVRASSGSKPKKAKNKGLRTEEVNETGDLVAYEG